jgi:hypothetical protein
MNNTENGIKMADSPFAQEALGDGPDCTLADDETELEKPDESVL